MPFPPTVFSPYEWDIKFGEASIGVPFGNVKMTNQISGFGNSGVASGQLEFDAADISGTFGKALLDGTQIRLVEKNSRVLPSRNYYIAKRSVENFVCHFTAYDIMSKTDQNFDISAFDQYFESNDTVQCSQVLFQIQAQCGFTSIGASDSGLEYINFRKEQLEKKTCRSILEAIAKAMCGVWISSFDNGAVLSCFGKGYYLSAAAECEKHSRIIYQGKQKITGLVCINSDTDLRYEYGDGEYGTVFEIDSPFVGGTPLDRIVWERINGYIYQGWKCSDALVSSLNTDVPAPAAVSLGNDLLISNNNVINIDGSGIYLSASADPQDEEQWKYYEHLQRQLDNKVELDRTAGNVQISNSTGLQFINRNNTSAIRAAAAEDTAIEKYSFNVGSGGITEFESVILDGKYPSIEVNSNATEFRLKYGDTIKNFALKWNGDNVTVEKEV